MCAGLYQPIEFNYITYEASSGDLSVPESDQRISYYGISGLPTLKFDGYTTVVGAGTGDADGHSYIPIIEDHFLNTTPVEVRFTGFSFTSGSAYADITVALHGELTSIANTYVRVALVENNITHGGHSWYNRILRDMFPNVTGTALTIQHDGQEQSLHLPFNLDPTWNPSNLLLIAWVQRDSDKFIYNSSSSSVVPHAVALQVNGVQQAVAVGNDPVVFGTTQITNVGTEADVYDLSLDTSELPAGWTSSFNFHGVDGNAATVSLASFGSDTFVPRIVPSGLGTGRITINVYSHGAEAVIASVSYIAIGSGADVLVVADDGAATLAETYVLPSVLADSRATAVWDRAFSGVNAAALNNFDAVIWVCGNESRGLEATDRTAIDSYLAQGGALLLTGENVAADCAYEGTVAYTWFKNTTHVRFLGNNSSNFAISGVAGDPIGDGLSFAIQGGDGANNQTNPDRVDVNDALAQPMFRYGTAVMAGAHVETATYKLVFCAFGLEAIATQTDRDVVMARSLDWLIGPPSTTPVEDVAPRALALAANAPNPFNPQTRIAFTVDRTGPVRLEVFDLQGRLVRTLVNEPLVSGDHAVLWDGQTADGSPAASGTYVYRLSANDQVLAHKMTLLK